MEITIITNSAWVELKNLAIKGAVKKRMENSKIPLAAKAVQATSRYALIFLFFCIKADWKPVWENESRMDATKRAMPRSPKSPGANRRARMIVRIKPNPRLSILKKKRHTPPRIAFFERDSGYQ